MVLNGDGAAAEFRRQWRRNWLRSITEFADRDLQVRTWLDPKNRNPHWSYVEFMSKYFDDLGLGDDGYLDAIEKGLVTEGEAKIVANLHEMLDRHEGPGNDDYDAAAILRDPNWNSIIEEAVNVKQRLVDVLDDPQEKQWLIDNLETPR